MFSGNAPAGAFKAEHVCSGMKHGAGGKRSSYAFRQISEGIPYHQAQNRGERGVRQRHVMLNDKIARASAEVKVGDVIEVAFGTKAVKVRVTSVQETIRKEDTKEMFEYI